MEAQSLAHPNRSTGLQTPRPPRFRTCVDHRGRHVLVSEEFLDRPNVVPVFKKVGGEGMAKRVATGRLGDSSLASGFFDGLLNDGFMQVIGDVGTVPRSQDECHAWKPETPTASPPLLPAWGYLRSNAFGRTTRPNPCFRSMGWGTGANNSSSLLLPWLEGMRAKVWPWPTTAPVLLLTNR